MPTSYLIESGPYAITPADIRAALGLVSQEHDDLIAVEIAYTCIEIESRYHRSLSSKVWMVSRDPSMHPILWNEWVRKQIGGGHEIGPDVVDPVFNGKVFAGTWRNVTTAPKPDMVERTIPLIARRCARKFREIADTMADERARAHVEAQAA